MDKPAQLPEVGDRVLLNEEAPEWTEGITFEVDDVRSWGVVCFTTTDVGRGVPKVDGKAMLYATWKQIEEITPAGSVR